jgi:ABC-type transporter Mla subunit MlaD
MILADVEETQLVSKLADLAAIGSDLSALVSGLEDSSLLDSLNASLEALRLASNDARALLTDKRIGDLLDDTSVTLADVRAVIADGRDEIGPLIEDLLTMADALESAAGSLGALSTRVEATDLIPQLASLADALGPAGRDLSDLAGRLDRLIASNDAGIADTIRSLRRVALQLESLLEQAEADPSRFIFGQPPPRRTPGGDP